MRGGRVTAPRFAFEAVPTRAVASVLNADRVPRLLVVSAPPGYGKTVTLARLHENWTARGWRCLWVTLDDRDGDLSDLLYLVQLAIQARPLEEVDRADPLTESYLHGGARMDGVVARLLQSEGPTVLFIDNLGFCRDPKLEAFLERLVFGASEGLHLVLSTTESAPVDISRAKLEVGAVELRSAQLSFDRISTARLFDSAGLTLADDVALDRIQRQTEGWPAAIRLLQVLMSSAAQELGYAERDSVRFVLDRFGGDQRDMAQVLTRRVLVGFDPDLVTFMLEVAQLREFSVELATFMTGRSEVRNWMDLLLARNVMIFPLDRDRRWFRFHTLLQEYLLAEGRQVLSPQRRSDVMARAAEWHSVHGEEVSALEIALEAPAMKLATRLIDRVAEVVVADQGRMAPYIRWFERIVGFGATPSLQAHAWYVWALCHTLQYERTRQALDALDGRVKSEAAADPSSGALRSRLSFLRLVIDVYLDRLQEAGDNAKIWLASEEPRDPLSQGTAAAVAGIAEFELGTVQQARRTMALSRAAMERAGSRWGLTWVTIVQACVEIASARPDLADESLREARLQAVAALGDDANVVSVLDFVHARAMLDLGKVSNARELAARGLAHASDQGLVLTAEEGLGACLGLWAPGDSQGPSAEAIDQVSSRYPPRLQALVSAGRVRRLLELGQASDAVDLATAIGLIDLTEDDTTRVEPRHRGEWLLARIDVLIAVGRNDEAQRLIDSNLRSASIEDRHRDRVELWLASAELHFRAGKPTRALHAFSQAIGAAALGRLIQPFLRRPVLLRALLTQHRQRDFGLVQSQDVTLLDRLRVSLDLKEPEGVVDASGGSEAPTARELQLLNLLDEGLSNQQVADRLSLSLTTVKWHLHNLYTKLGVGSRSAALAKARAGGMLRH